MSYILPFVSLLNEMSPYLLFGFFVAGLLKAYVPKERYIKHIARSDFRSVLWATIAGIPLPLCSCGMIPTGVSLYKEGASKGATVSFFIAAPQTNVNCIAITYSLLGLPFSILRIFATFLMGIVGGAATNKFDGGTHVHSHECCKGSEQKESGNKFFGAIRYGFVEVVRDIGKWLVIGILLAGAVTIFLPEAVFATYLSNPVLNILMVLLLSVPIYTCATAAVPMAAVLLMKGLTPGAAFVLLTAGPVTSMATMAIVGKILGKRTLLIYVLCIITGSVAFGLSIDYIFPASWFNISAAAGDFVNFEHNNISWFESVCSAALVGLIGNAYYTGRKASLKTFSDAAIKK